MFYKIDQERALQIMKKRKVSQRKLAELTSISRISIGNAVRGNPCRYNTLKAICQALDVYPGYLIGEWDKQERFTEFCETNGKPFYGFENIPELNLDAFQELNPDAFPELNLDALT